MHTLTYARPSIQSASTLCGYRVRDHQNEDLGTIEELLIDPATGQIVYAVLSFAGVLAVGDKLVVVPWTLLTLNNPDRVFILPVERGALEQAPAFDELEWPDFSDEGWGTEIRNFYGCYAGSRFES
jgi:hypothetical protein